MGALRVGSNSIIVIRAHRYMGISYILGSICYKGTSLWGHLNLPRRYIVIWVLSMGSNMLLGHIVGHFVQGAKRVF